jgi:hypothetical protein
MDPLPAPEINGQTRGLPPAQDALPPSSKSSLSLTFALLIGLANSRERAGSRLISERFP